MHFISTKLDKTETAGLWIVFTTNYFISTQEAIHRIEHGVPIFEDETTFHKIIHEDDLRCPICNQQFPHRKMSAPVDDVHEHYNQCFKDSQVKREQ